MHTNRNEKTKAIGKYINDVSGHRAHLLTYISTLNRLARHWLHLRHQNVPQVLPNPKITKC